MKKNNVVGKSKLRISKKWSTLLSSLACCILIIAGITIAVVAAIVIFA